MGKLMAPEAIDVYICKRLKEKRVQLGISQEDLGEVAKVTFQQIQKYEQGTNRVPISRLFLMSIELQCDLNYFVKDYSSNQPISNNDNDDQEFHKMLKYFRRLSPTMQKSMMQFVKNCASDVQ